MKKKAPEIHESVEELKSLMGQATQVHQKQRLPYYIFYKVDKPKIVNKSPSC